MRDIKHSAPAPDYRLMRSLERLTMCSVTMSVQLEILSVGLCVQWGKEWGPTILGVKPHTIPFSLTDTLRGGEVREVGESGRRQGWG